MAHVVESVFRLTPAPCRPSLSRKRWRTWLGVGPAPVAAETDRQPDPEGDKAAADRIGDAATDPASFSLLRAYLASTLEVVRHADAPPDSVIEPAGLQALVAEALTALDPVAREAGLRLHRDLDSRSDGAALLDARGFRLALRHLVLRALAREARPGHIRVMTTISPGLTRVAVLSRAPDPPGGPARGEDVGLWAAERILQDMGGGLDHEPRRAGYLPLSIVLQAPLPASLSQVA